MADLSLYSDEELASIAGEPLSVAQNNPGNMRSADGGFQKFETPKAGLDAMQNDLLAKVSGNSPIMKAHFGEGYSPTLRNVISTWAPPEENNTENYINFVAQHSGLNPDQPLTSQDVSKIMGPMVQMEGGQKASQHFGKLMGTLPEGKQYAQADNIQTDAQSDPLSGYSDEELSKIAGGEPPQADIAQPYSPDVVRSAYQSSMDRVAKPINDVASAALSQLTKYINPLNQVSDALSPLVPDQVKEAVSGGVAKAGDYLKNENPITSPIYQGAKEKISQLGNEVKDLSSYDPNLAKDLSALGENAQLAGNLPFIKPATEIGTSVIGDTLKSGGNAIAKSAENRILNAKQAFAQDLILEKETPTVAAERAGRTTAGTGIRAKDVYNPTPEEQSIAQTVAALPVSPKNTIQKNLNIIQDANTAEAKGLKTYLQKNDINFPRQEFGARLDAISQQLPQHPLLVGDEAAIKTANMLVEQFKKIFSTEKGSASGLLEARKKFDSFVKDWKGKSAFDAPRENAFQIAQRAIRDAANGFIAEKVPNAGVKASLTKQSNLFRAIENIKPKAGAEASTRIGRVAQKAEKFPLKKAAISSALPLIGIAAAPQVVLPALGVGATIYGAGKVVASPTLQRIAGKTLSGTGSALKKLGGRP